MQSALNPVDELDHRVDVDLDGLRFAIEVHSGIDRYISADIARDRVWEPFETAVFRKLCAEGDFIVDIGANIGWYSLVASRCVGTTGLVVAAEPDFDNHALLMRNLAANGATNVTARRTAIGGRSGSATFYRSPENMGDHRLFDGGESRESSEVEVVTLAELLNATSRTPRLIKSDTQGSEWSIVCGAGDDAFGPECAWLIEFWPYGLSAMKADPADLLGWFAQRGYRFYELSEGNPRLVPTTVTNLLIRADTDLSAANRRFINLLLLHQADLRLHAIDEFVR